MTSIPLANIASPSPVKAAEIVSAELDTLNAKFDKAHPRDIVRWAVDYFGNRDGGLAMTSSFGADSMCTIHLATQILPDIRIIFINTGYLFPETLKFMEAMRERFKLNVLEFHTRNDPVVWLTVNGEPDPTVRNNWQACCAANKDPVIDRAMAELAPAAYLRGVRGDQTEERAKMKVVQWVNRYKTFAVSPILRWSTRDVFYYMKEHNLPHHPLVEKGYTSIGCTPLTCTKPVGAEDGQRAGRWAGSDKKERGINQADGANLKPPPHRPTTACRVRFHFRRIMRGHSRKNRSCRHRGGKHRSHGQVVRTRAGPRDPCRRRAQSAADAKGLYDRAAGRQWRAGPAGIMQGAMIEVMPRNDSPRHNRNSHEPGISHVAWYVNDFESALAHLRKHNVKFLSDIIPAIAGGRIISFEDCEGNMTQIVERK